MKDFSGYKNRLYWETLHHSQRGNLSAVGYEGMGEGFNRAAYRLRLAAVERLLKRANALPINDLLEAAVGVGAYGLLWQRLRVNRWTGIDISPVAIEDLSQRYPKHQFVVTDLTSEQWEPSLQNRSFDLVTAIDVLYHIVAEDAFARALTNLAARVNPQGMLLVSDVFCDPARQIAPHVKRRPLTTYQAMLEQAGFSLVDREPVFSILGDPVTRPQRPLTDVLCFQTWRVISKLIRTTPTSARNLVGTGLVKGLTPIDTILRATGITRGMNLELALFQRQLTR